MWREGEVERVCELAKTQLGKLYAIGGPDPVTGAWVVRGKPEITEADPMAFDCSGFSRWLIGQGVQDSGLRIVLPHGAQEQLAKCVAVGAGRWRPLDLGFGDMDMDPKDKRPIDHVIIRLNEQLVIEARGPQKNRDYGKVITRPVSAWEAWPGFLGWWRVPGIYAGLA